MSDHRNQQAFDIWVEDDRIRVQHVAHKSLGLLKSGHPVGGDYADRVVRLPRGASRDSRRAALLHELGHYLYDRDELRAGATEEEICDMLSWLPGILIDERNGALRAFLGL